MYLISYLKGYSFMEKKVYQNPPPGNSYIFTLFLAINNYCKKGIFQSNFNQIFIKLLSNHALNIFSIIHDHPRNSKCVYVIAHIYLSIYHVVQKKCFHLNISNFRAHCLFKLRFIHPIYFDNMI